MVRKGLILCGILCGLFTAVHAQERVDVVADPLIAALQAFRAEHEINPASRPTVSLGEKKVTTDKRNMRRVRTRGFRVQIFSGPNRSDAVSAQNGFLRQYNDMGAYINYEEPNFRVKVGDFRTRSEANTFMRKLRGQYSNVFVFVEDIWIWQ
ncbi:SPOR domain-containing protein [Sphingobacterium corticis]|uniref:SPOR domain-containing protein n=1 Tax=Sphingobacterium corticis TaxID=1812823 RepID=A0ABW5NKV4_9SPHI